MSVVQFSVRENLLVVTGTPETKELKDMMPEILKQVGPQQFSFLKDLVKNIIPESKAEEDEDDVPELVGGNFEDASKKWDGGGEGLVEWESSCESAAAARLTQQYLIIESTSA